MNRGQIDVLHAVTSSLSLVLLRGQLSYLRDAGFHPGVLCSSGTDVELMQVREHLQVLTVPMEREISPLRDLISLLRLLPMVRRTHPLISNVGTPKAGLLVGLAARLNRIPCRVYTLRGLRLETARGLKRRILVFTERVSCRCAHRVVCVSPSLRQRAIDLGLVRAEKTLVLGAGSSNGVDADRFEPTPQRMTQAAEIRRQLRIDPGVPVIGYIGRLSRDKGILELLSAFRSLREKFPDARLMLIGQYDEGDPVPPPIRTAIESDPGITRVPFAHEIAPYYLLMDLFVLPTYREGFPNAVLEAQAAERAVVTTQASGAVDSVVDGITGIVVPIGDAKALVDAIARLLADPEMATRMGRAGRERVKREFRQEDVWEALAALYREMLRQRGLPVPSAKDIEVVLGLEKP